MKFAIFTSTVSSGDCWVYPYFHTLAYTSLSGLQETMLVFCVAMLYNFYLLLMRINRKQNFVFREHVNTLRNWTSWLGSCKQVWPKKIMRNLKSWQLKGISTSMLAKQWPNVTESWWLLMAPMSGWQQPPPFQKTETESLLSENGTIVKMGTSQKLLRHSQLADVHTVPLSRWLQ